MFNRKTTDPIANTPPPRGPSRASLDSHLSKMDAINQARQTIAERAGALVADIEAAERAQSAVATLRASIDEKTVAAAVAGTPSPDLSRENEELLRLEQRAERLAQSAEVAKKARAELQSKSEALLNEYRPLQPQLSRLCHDAIVERMIACAPALQDAERAYRAQLRRVFLYACAADQLSHTNRLGPFLDSQRFELHVPQLPLCEPFATLCPDRFAAHADYGKLCVEAEHLIGRVLQGDADA